MLESVFTVRVLDIALNIVSVPILSHVTSLIADACSKNNTFRQSPVTLIDNSDKNYTHYVTSKVENTRLQLWKVLVCIPDQQEDVESIMEVMPEWRE